MLEATIFAILVGIQLIIILPKYFIRKNSRQASQKAFEEYLQELNRYDKMYASHGKTLADNLNKVNYWLKTGNDPAEMEEEENNRKNVAKKVLTPEEAKRWSNSIDNQDDNLAMKQMRNEKFDIIGLEANEFGQEDMTFYYSDDYNECICYCATPLALEKKFYKNIIYFTTARPTQLPMVYPYKYEGAQMLSLYKHPCQAIWFLKNWKKIRDGLENQMEEPQMEIDDILDDFDI